MKKTKKTTIIGILGSTLDAASPNKTDRWSKWRPTVSLCQHEELLVNQFELLYEPKFLKIAEITKKDIEMVSPETKVNLHPIAPSNWWDFAQVYSSLFDFARNYTFDTEQNEYLIHITTGSHVAQICLFLLTEAHWLPGKLLQSEPPSRQSTSALFKIIDLDLSQYDSIASRFHQNHTEAVSHLKHGIHTKNKRFNKLIERIEQVAVLSKDPVLITGPTGAGKSKLAKRIYELKKSRQMITGTFVEVNSATLRGDQAMSALFGHIKGSFTGATNDRPGLIRKADKGVLFLDEIGDLNADEQAMLLRALEDKRFLPVGADEEVQSDFQLIAGTNHNLLADVKCGKFRDDLLARINLWTFQLPSLRDRIEDIEPNIIFELEQNANNTGRHISFNKEARKKFLDFALSTEATWPGNFRDLNGAIRRMVTLAEGGRINELIVNEEIERVRELWNPDPTPEIATNLVELLDQSIFENLDRFERVQLEDVISVCKTSRSLSDAGRILFSNSRKQKTNANDADRLRKYLFKFGLSWDQIQS
jgi:transcriptional regulatory protein RtcR